MPSCMDVTLYIHGSASLCDDSLDVVGIPEADPGGGGGGFGGCNPPFHIRYRLLFC